MLGIWRKLRNPGAEATKSPHSQTAPLQVEEEVHALCDRDPLKEACLSQGCLGELVIKGPARLTALAKPCSLLGRDSGFIGSRVEETEARINRKYRNSLRICHEISVSLFLQN